MAMLAHIRKKSSVFVIVINKFGKNGTFEKVYGWRVGTSNLNSPGVSNRIK